MAGDEESVSLETRREQIRGTSMKPRLAGARSDRGELKRSRLSEKTDTTQEGLSASQGGKGENFFFAFWPIWKRMSRRQSGKVVPAIKGP